MEKVLFKDESLISQKEKAYPAAIESFEPLPSLYKELTGETLKRYPEDLERFDSKEEILRWQYRDKISGDFIERAGEQWKFENVKDSLPMQKEDVAIKWLEAVKHHQEVITKSRLIEKDLLSIQDEKLVMDEEQMHRRCSIIATKPEQVERWELIDGILENVRKLHKLGVDITEMERIRISGRYGPFFIRPSVSKSPDQICNLIELKKIASIVTHEEVDKKMEQRRR